MQTFFKTYRPEAVGYNFTIVKINGGQDYQDVVGLEVQLHPFPLKLPFCLKVFLST